MYLRISICHFLKVNDILPIKLTLKNEKKKFFTPQSFGIEPNNTIQLRALVQNFCSAKAGKTSIPEIRQLKQTAMKK